MVENYTGRLEGFGDVGIALDAMIHDIIMENIKLNMPKGHCDGGSISFDSPHPLVDILDTVGKDLCDIGCHVFAQSLKLSDEYDGERNNGFSD